MLTIQLSAQLCHLLRFDADVCLYYKFWSRMGRHVDDWCPGGGSWKCGFVYLYLLYNSSYFTVLAMHVSFGTPGICYLINSKSWGLLPTIQFFRCSNWNTFTSDNCHLSVFLAYFSLIQCAELIPIPIGPVECVVDWLLYPIQRIQSNHPLSTLTYIICLLAKLHLIGYTLVIEKHKVVHAQRWVFRNERSTPSPHSYSDVTELQLLLVFLPLALQHILECL